MKTLAYIKKLLIVNPREKHEEIFAKLETLKERLGWLKRGIDDIDQFFIFMMDLHDYLDERRTKRNLSEPFADLVADLRRLNCEESNMIINDLDTVLIRLERERRTTNGMNRSVPHKIVTDRDIHYGGIYNLPVQTIYYWKQKKDEPKGCLNIREIEYMNSYDAIDRSLEQYIKDKSKPMIQVIENIRVNLKAM